LGAAEKEELIWREGETKRRRDREMERWRSGEMEIWRDGEMIRQRDCEAHADTEPSALNLAL